MVFRWVIALLASLAIASLAFYLGVGYGAQATIGIFERSEVNCPMSPDPLRCFDQHRLQQQSAPDVIKNHLLNP
jgi:hypothetical protein